MQPLQRKVRHKGRRRREVASRGTEEEGGWGEEAKGAGSENPPTKADQTAGAGVPEEPAGNKHGAAGFTWPRVGLVRPG